MTTELFFGKTLIKKGLIKGKLSDFEMELPMQLPDGQVKWIRLRSRPRRLLDGRKVSLKGFTSRKGGTFDAALVIDKDKGVAFDFGNNNKERKKK